MPCQIFHLKCTNFSFGWGSTPDPTERARSVPDSILDLGDEKEVGGEEGNGREKKEGKGGRVGEVKG